MAAAGARLELDGADGQILRRLVLDRNGKFVLTRLAPGAYDLYASLPGFSLLLAAPVLHFVVAGGELAETDVQFALCAQSPEPRHEQRRDLKSPSPGLCSPGTPTWKRPAADPEKDRRALSEGALATRSRTPTSTDDLPLASRDWEDLPGLLSAANDATLPDSTPGQDTTEDTPQVDRDTASSGTTAAGLSFNGLAPTTNETRQDGLSAMQGFRSGQRGGALGGAHAAPSFAQAALRSLRVLPATFSGQRGGAAGAVLAFTTERGETHTHGALFAFDRQSAWGAVNPYSLVQHYGAGVLSNFLIKPADNELQTGGSLGLSLAGLRLPGRWARATGLFGSFEYQQRNNQGQSSPATPGFYALTPTQTALLGNRGVTRAQTQTALTFLDSLSGPLDRHDTRSLGFVRMDTAAGRRDGFGAVFQTSEFRSPSGASDGGPSTAVIARGRGSVGDSVLNVNAFSGHWLHSFSPAVSHELRGQWAHDLEYETPHVPLAAEPAIGPGGLAPEVSIAPQGFSYGTSASLGRVAYPDEHRLELTDSLILTTARHLITLGADWSRLDDDIATLNNAEGMFLYDSDLSRGHAGGLVDWITDFTYNVHAYPNGGCPSIFSTVHDFCFRSFTQSFGGVDTHFVTHEIAAFAEDAFRPAHGLQLTVGLRWDYTLLPIPQTPNRKLDSAFATLGGPARGSTAVFPEDRNNFGPRASLTWSPGKRHSLIARLGYGGFFGRLPGATLQAALANTALPSTTASIRITPAAETLCPQVANQGFGYPCTYTATPPAAVVATTSATLFGTNFRLPAVQRATLTAESGLGRRLSLQATYQLAVATQLSSSVDRNIAPSTSTIRYVLQGGAGQPGLFSGETFVVPLYAARLSSNYGPVTTLVSEANATFHAFTAEARLRGPGELDLHGSFTLSRSIDYAPQLGATPQLNSRFDPYTPGYDKGLSSLNFPARFSGDLVFRTSLRRGIPALRHSLGGWRAAAVATVSSGAPYSYAVFGGTRLSGGRESLNGAGGATYLPTVGRNTLRLPARSRVDLRVGRDVPFGERFRLNVFAQAFNLLNARNVTRIETRAFLVGTPASPGAATPLVFQDAAAIASEGLSTPAFGQPLSSTSGLSRERLLEVGLRLVF